MTTHMTMSQNGEQASELSLYHLLNAETLANPYPLYHRLRSEDPVHWDPYLHSWVATRYTDVVYVLQHFSADRMPTPEQFMELGLPDLVPLANIMVHLMLFLDPPKHTRIRGLASRAFTPRHVEILRSHIKDITNQLLDAVQDKGYMDILADLAYPLPAIVTAEMLGVPTSDWRVLTKWSADFAQVLGNFQHHPERIVQMVRSLDEMIIYFRDAIEDHKKNPRDGLISAFLHAEVDGDHLTEDEIVANTIITMVGGQETTTNLICNGLLMLLQHRDQFEQLRTDLSLLPSAIEEMLRYESPIQHTVRQAPHDIELGGKLIRARQPVIAVMGAANRDPARFPDPDHFDIHRQDNRHVAFAWASHFCFGAPLARLEGQIALDAIMRRLSHLQLGAEAIHWSENLGFRGLLALPVTFSLSRA